jgi:hypothetical protein
VPWFKVDDGFAFHRKTLRAPNQAIGLWVKAGSWCAQQLTDGHVPIGVILAFGSSLEDAQSLVEAELWEVEGEGFRFRNWAEFQPSKEEVERERERARKRKQEWRESRRNGTRPPSGPSGTDKGTPTGTDKGTTTETDGGVTPTPTRPDPTRPDPTVLPTEVPSASSPTKRGTRLPSDFVITDEMKDWAVKKGMTGSYVLPRHEQFMNHWPAQAGKAGVKLDWVLTWKNWMLRDFTPKDNVHSVDFGGEPERRTYAKDDVRARFQ